MRDRKQEREVRLRHVTAILDAGELLCQALTPGEKRALKMGGADIDEVEAKRRYRWDDQAQ